MNSQSELNLHTGWRALRNLILQGSSKRFFQLYRLIRYFPGYFALRRTVSKSCFREIATDQPGMLFKFLGNFLSLFFSTEERLRILVNHFDFFQMRFADSSNRLFPPDGLLIWSKGEAGEDAFSVRMTLPDGTFMEGNLTMTFWMNHTLLHTMTFSFLPGEMVGSDSHQVIFIGGSQGPRGQAAMVRRAAKANGEVCPAAMLFLSFQALGRAVGIGNIFGIASRDHVCGQVNASPWHYVSAYDEFWERNGGARCAKGFRMGTSVSAKPILLDSASHRSRAKRKREHKRGLMAEMTRAFERHFHRPNGTPAILGASRRLSAPPLLLPSQALQEIPMG